MELSGSNSGSPGLPQITLPNPASVKTQNPFTSLRAHQQLQSFFYNLSFGLEPREFSRFAYQFFVNVDVSSCHEELWKHHSRQILYQDPDFTRAVSTSFEYSNRYTVALRMIACTYSRVWLNGIDSTNSWISRYGPWPCHVFTRSDPAL
jgi:hypothetical protein